MRRTFARYALRAGALSAACLAGASHAQQSAPGTNIGPPTRNSKLLLTGGVSSIDGAAGGGLTPWAVTASYAAAGEVGATAFLSRATTQDYALNVYGVAVGYDDRFELSLARQRFDAGIVVPGTRIKLDIAGLKWRVAGDAVLDADTWMPQIAIGAQFKHVDPGADVGGILDGAGVKRNGVDVYLSATKLLLAQAVLINATLRATKANQNGLLGFGSVDKSRYSLQPEASLALMLRKDLAVGIEYRFKPDNLAFAGAAFAEDDWKDVFIAWSPNKHVSLTAAYLHLGNIVGHARQTGAYVSLQLAF